MRGTFKFLGDKRVLSQFRNVPMERMTHLFFKSVFILGVFLALAIELKGQSPAKILIKTGGYPVFNDGVYRGYIFCFEWERAFKGSRYFSSGFRSDYVHIPFYEQYSGHLIALGVGYEFKYYPLRNIKGYLLNGPFVGLFPYYYLPINKSYRYGPGLGANLGYQQRIGKKLALSAELNMVYMKNFNEQVPMGNPDDHYFNLLPQVKVGLRF